MSGATLTEKPEDIEVTDADRELAEADLQDEETEIEEEVEKEDFFENLVEDLSDEENRALASKLISLVKTDKDAREARDKVYKEGIERTGLMGPAPGGASFDGASNVTHPGLVQAGLDFVAHVIPEFFPPEGPVKQVIPGSNVKPQFLDKAIRTSRHMNWQLMFECEEFKSQFEKMTSQLPFSGSSYIKTWFSETRGRPEFEFIPLDDIFLPFEAKYFYTSPRITHNQRLTLDNYVSRVESGMYYDPDPNSRTALEPDDISETSETSDKVEGKENNGNDTDDPLIVLEVDCYHRFSWDDKPKPYLISVNKAKNLVVSVYRNWEEDDKYCERLCHIVEFNFLVWRGAYGIGLPHVIGGMSAAATGALRALLDSAHINNHPSLMKLKGANVSGQSKQIEATGVVEIEASVATDDIRKIVMPIPFNQPSPTLMQLLGFLSENMASAVKTALDDTAMDSNANTPVGTQLSRVEQGLKVLSSIHTRMHESMRRLFKVVWRINGNHLDEENLQRKAGELLAHRKDYEGPMDIIPVSDPRVFSNQQRMVQAQLIVGRASMLPQIYDLRKTEERFLRTMQIPNPEEILVKIPEPERMNAVNENVSMVMGKPVVAFPDQHHIAHLTIHFYFMFDPLLGSNPANMQKMARAVFEHSAQHISFLYAQRVQEMTSMVMNTAVEHFMHEIKGDVQLEIMLDGLFVEIIPLIHQLIHKELNQFVQPIQQLAQLVQSMQPPTPMDPTMVAMEEIKANMKMAQDRIAADMQVTQETLKNAIEKALINAGVQIKKIEADKEKVDAQIGADHFLQEREHDHNQIMALADQAATAAESAEQHTRTLEQADQAHNQALQSEQMKAQQTAAQTAQAQNHEMGMTRMGQQHEAGMAQIGAQQKMAEGGLARAHEAEQKHLDREASQRSTAAQIASDHIAQGQDRAAAFAENTASREHELKMTEEGRKHEVTMTEKGQKHEAKLAKEKNRGEARRNSKSQGPGNNRKA